MFNFDMFGDSVYFENFEKCRKLPFSRVFDQNGEKMLTGNLTRFVAAAISEILSPRTLDSVQI